MSVRIFPSLLNADFLSLRTTLDALKESGIQQLHLDIMDGHFVPNLSFGPFLIRTIKQHYDFFLDTHLMITSPDAHLSSYIDSGSDAISVHVEACDHLDSCIEILRSNKVQAGVALNPATSLQHIEEILHKVDRVVIMSVNPGFGGQRLLAYVLGKVRRLQEKIRREGLCARICIDGGVKDSNFKEVIAAGAQDIVVGSYLFDRQASIGDRVRSLQLLME